MFQYDSPIITFLARVGDMIILNVLWLVCSLPVVTFGPATAAAHYVALKFVRDEGTSVVRMFFQAFRQNFRQGLFLGLAALAAGLVLGVDLWLILSGRITFSPGIRLALLVALWLLTFLYLMVMVYVWAVMARFDNTVKNTVFNACVIAIANIRSTLMMICWDVSLAVLAVVCIAFVPQLAALCMMFGVPTLFILNATRLRPILDACMEAQADGTGPDPGQGP